MCVFRVAAYRARTLQRAVSILSDARLNTDYASKILQAISLSPKPMPLVLKYVRTAKPLLTEPDDIDLYTVALAESSLLEAWQFQRTFSEGNETRPRLLKKILDWCFTRVSVVTLLTRLLICLSSCPSSQRPRSAAWNCTDTV